MATTTVPSAPSAASDLPGPIMATTATAVLSAPSAADGDWILAGNEEDAPLSFTASGHRECKDEKQDHGYMSASAVFEFPTVSLDATSVKTVLSVVAPQVDSCAVRASLRLVAVLDKSGSMRGEKLDLVIKTMLFMLDYFTDQDALGIVAFDTDVTVLAPLTFCNDAGKSLLKNSLKTFRAGTTTNLSGGLLRGVELHSENAVSMSRGVVRSLVSKSVDSNEVSMSRGVVRSTFLFTDGQANMGIQDAPSLRLATGAVLQELGENRCTISTFGFGVDHSGDLLQSLADVGDGIYCYVEDEDAIGKAFGQALGGLLTTTHQNVRLEIDCEPGFSVDDVFTGFPVSTKTIVKSESSIVRTVVELGDLFAEERRDVLVGFRLPSLDNASHEPFGHLCIRGFSVLRNGSESSVIPLVIGRGSQEQREESERRHEQVERHWNRYVGTSELESARDAANGGNLSAAQAHLKKAIETLESSWLTQQGDVLSTGLLDDLKDCLADMQTQDLYQSVGGKKMNCMGASHGKQRACIGSNSAFMYSNAEQNRVSEEFGLSVGQT